MRDPGSERRRAASLVAIALVVAVVGSLGAPLITSVATDLHVPLSAAQWTLTAALLSGAVAGPVLGRIGAGPHRRTAILIALALVALGGALSTIPAPFALLLVGRVLQGVGIALVPLLMSVARDHLPAERATSTIATLSVATTVAIGVGYPLVGLLDQVAGLRIAYALGLALPLVGLVLAWRAIPRDAARPTAPLDVPGAILLAVATTLLLLAVAERSVWIAVWPGVVMLVAAAVLFGVWARVELRSPHPLADLRVLGRAPVVRANIAMLGAGVAMYLLFVLITRYVQTPPDAGYGFGLGGLAAGAMLIPFSVLGFVAGRAVARLLGRMPGSAILIACAALVVGSAALFALAPGVLVLVLVSMAALGAGVGGVSAVMPTLLLDGTPRDETASVLAMNQIVRSVGFAIGSAVAGLLLAAFTPAGAVAPDAIGYVVAALVAIPVIAVPVLAAAVDRVGRA